MFVKFDKEAISNKIILAIAGSLLLASCETAGVIRTAKEPAWSATGYLQPNATGDPELIGFYFTQRECLQAADEWRTRQVVGNPVFAECLPVDRN